MSSNDTSTPPPPVSSVIISKKKQQDKDETLVYEMNEHDVLLVRSKIHDTDDTKGKVVLRQLVTDVAAKYAASQRRADKQRMVMEILHTFTRQQGGRFLQCRSKDAVPTPPPPSPSHPWRLVTDQTTMVNVIKVALRDAMARKHQTGKRLATAAKVKSTPTNNNSNNTHHQEGNSTVASSTVGKDSHAGHEEEDGSTVVDDHTSTGHVKVEPTSSMSPGVKALPEQVESIRGQLAAKPSLDSTNNEARDLLVYLALVGQIPSSSQDTSNNSDALMARALMEQRQPPLPPPQQPSVEDTLNQLILEQQLIEQQRRELLQRQFERRNRQQLEELIQLEQLRQHLGNHRAMLPPSTNPGFPPMGGSSSSLEDAHAELVMAQALEQARLAQQLSASRLAPPPPADLAMAQALEQARLAQHLSNIPLRPPPPPTNADFIMASALEQARLAQQFNPTRLVAPQPPPPPPMNNANAELIMAQALEQARIAELLQRFPQ